MTTRPKGLGEFSSRTRSEAIRRFGSEVFDVLVIGGGISGACVARDAASRGLKVALIEKRDFAWGTSSRSSKLIHGGLRYLENMEFGLVFEALAERALLLKTAPHMVRPLPFYFPVYDGDPTSKRKLSLGMWLYDLLALFRTPEFHRNLSAEQFTAEIPFIRTQGLQGGFRYSDASMWDDALTVQTLRSAAAMGAAVANYVEALRPLRSECSAARSSIAEQSTQTGPEPTDDRITGFVVRDREKPEGKGDVRLAARQTIVCAGPWTDSVGAILGGAPSSAGAAPAWHPWLMPSKGVHLVFDHRKIPVPGALVMSHPQDGRISFVIPRTDYGDGVTIVGTTDGPAPDRPEDVSIDLNDVKYLLSLLEQYFPDLKFSSADIVSAYVGVRPLMAPNAPGAGGSLQKVSREHHIGNGPGGTVVVAGGKYTTSRRMAQEVVDFALKSWKRAHKDGKAPQPVPPHGRSRTHTPINPLAVPQEKNRALAALPKALHPLVERFGAESEELLAEADEAARKEAAQDTRENSGIRPQKTKWPAGFPELDSQFRHAMRTEMVMHLEDFYLRRVPLQLARQDQGLPWAEALARIWEQERGMSAPERDRELEQLRAELARRSDWKTGFYSEETPAPAESGKESAKEPDGEAGPEA